MTQDKPAGETELKTCPFCNEKMELRPDGVYWRHPLQSGMQCVGERIHVPALDLAGIAAWNRRASGPAPEAGRDGALEEAAQLLDANAQYFNKIRDPGMANHDRSLAKRIRALKAEGPSATEEQDKPSAGGGDEARRDQFEIWAERDNRRLDPLEFEERTPGNNHYYADDSTNHAYVGWCAATPAPALREALEKIERWELPPSGRYWDKERKDPMPYSAAFGSHGEREVIQGYAREALAALSAGMQEKN